VIERARRQCTLNRADVHIGQSRHEVARCGCTPVIGCRAVLKIHTRGRTTGIHRGVQGCVADANARRRESRRLRSSSGGVASIRTMLDVLDMPFTNTVTIAWPGGKLVTRHGGERICGPVRGKQKYRLFVFQAAQLHQRVIGRRILALTALKRRRCPRNFEPVSAKLLPKASGDVIGGI